MHQTFCLSKKKEKTQTNKQIKACFPYTYVTNLELQIVVNLNRLRCFNCASYIVNYRKQKEKSQQHRL